MSQTVRQLFSGAILLAVVTPVEAQVFFGSEVGVNFAPKFAMTGFSNDRPSVCDEYINPLYASVPGCTAPNRLRSRYRLNPRHGFVPSGTIPSPCCKLRCRANCVSCRVGSL